MTESTHENSPDSFIAALVDEVEVRAAKWPTFELLRTVIKQSPSSLRSEALVKLAQLEERVTEGEALGDV